MYITDKTPSTGSQSELAGGSRGLSLIQGRGRLRQRAAEFAYRLIQDEEHHQASRSGCVVTASGIIRRPKHRAKKQMASDLMSNPQHWRDRAEEARTNAEEVEIQRRSA
jgi:hypothetical protein